MYTLYFVFSTIHRTSFSTFVWR